MGSIEDEGGLGELPSIVAWAFGDTEASARKWLLGCGLAELRAMRDGSRILGGLARVPMAQWFGAERVSSLGIAGVAVAPEARGQKVALELLSETLREARREGFALSVLYPATLSLYRALGYELAGYHCRYTLRLAECPRYRGAAPLRAGVPADTPLVESVYNELAQQRAGYLERGPYVWSRVRGRGEPARLAVAEAENGRIDGYLYLAQQSTGAGQHDLWLNDFVARTPAALERLLGYLAAHRTTADNAIFHGGPSDARLYGFPEKAFKVEVKNYWMLRIVDVARALSARGYGARQGEYQFELSDPLLSENSGAYRITVEAGRARVERSSVQPSFRIGVAALASLYTGFANASELMHAGLVEGSASELVRFSDLFAGPAPSLADFF